MSSSVLTYFPNVLPVERAVIGLALRDPDAAEELFSRIQVEWFFLPEHARYFSVMHERKGQGKLDWPFMKARFPDGEDLRLIVLAHDRPVRTASYPLSDEACRIGLDWVERHAFTTMQNGDGPAVTPRRTGRTERASASARSKPDKMLLTTNFISNWANAIPMQRRTPPPKGKYSRGEYRRSKNRSGRN